jgi:hypothetical protein
MNGNPMSCNSPASSEPDRAAGQGPVAEHGDARGHRGTSGRPTWSAAPDDFDSREDQSGNWRVWVGALGAALMLAAIFLAKLILLSSYTVVAALLLGVVLLIVFVVPIAWGFCLRCLFARNRDLRVLEKDLGVSSPVVARIVSAWAVVFLCLPIWIVALFAIYEIGLGGLLNDHSGELLAFVVRSCTQGWAAVWTWSACILYALLAWAGFAAAGASIRRRGPSGK